MIERQVMFFRTQFTQYFDLKNTPVTSDYEEGDAAQCIRGAVVVVVVITYHY